MKVDALCYPYPSRRTTVYAKKGMVATTQTLAAQAGLEVLKKGGNAIDAALATAACLTVVEPCSCGIGGDAFALIWYEGKLYGLNASGPAPRAISLAAVRRAGYEKMPLFGWLPVTVPGVPAAWAALSRRFGRLPLSELVEPAAVYGEEGYPVSPTVSRYWQRAYNRYEPLRGQAAFSPWFETFAPNGRAPLPGELWHSPGHAATLREIGASEGRSFYRGALAEKIIHFSQQEGGYLSRADMEGYQVEWVDPLEISYRGYEVWELPPNGQGIIALMALGILRAFEYSHKESVDVYHKQVEALKIAFAAGQRWITDPRKMRVTPAELLSEAQTLKRRELIGPRAGEPVPGPWPRGGTVYLATADGAGNMVSYIQSNYLNFGSGLVVPGTGIALQNRGSSFSLDPTQHNCLEPGKRPYHTIMPGFLTKNRQAVGPFGVMGAFMQPQGHVEVVMNTIDFNMNPQAALDAPRWRWVVGKKLEVEHHFPHHIATGLAGLGHEVTMPVDPYMFGRGQIIWRNPAGVLAGGTDGRLDGGIAAW